MKTKIFNRFNSSDAVMIGALRDKIRSHLARVSSPREVEGTQKMFTRFVSSLVYPIT